MRAFQQDTYGDASVVHLASVPEPSPQAGEILIAPVAVGVNSGDVRVMQGVPLLIRAFFGVRRPRVAVRGMDVAGTVVAIGSGASSDAGVSFAVGDRVLAETSGGGFADRVVVSANRVVPVPATIDLLTAATVPTAGSTAWVALTAAGLAEGEAQGRRVLILGASGGVASFAIALAQLRGAHVTAVCRPSAVDAVRSWGVTDVRARGGAEPLSPGETFDAIIDIAGVRPLRELRSRLSPGGRVALVSGEGSRMLGPVGRLLRSVLLTRKAARLVPVAQKTNPAVVRALLELIAAGDLTPRITSVVDFAEVPAALAAVARGDVVGKSVVSVRPEAAQKSDK